MIFEQTPLAGVFVVRPERREDERGYFARTFCEDEYRQHGLDGHVAQTSVSFNATRHTVRGIHFQASPYRETKTIRCLHGEIFDVAVDVRPQSPTFLRHCAVELSDTNGTALVVSPGVAHGFMTLTDRCSVGYQMSVPYAAGSARGLRWNDAALGIPWPVISDADVVISEKDLALPLAAELDFSGA